MTIIKDVLGIALAFWILYEPSVSNWWVLFSVLILAGSYSKPN